MHFLVFLLLHICCVFEGRGQNAFYTHCPDTFVEGENRIICTIDKTMLGGCGSPGSLVRFRFTPNGGTPNFPCTTRFDEASCDTNVNAAGCACMNHFPNDTQTYLFNFNFSQAAHAGGSIDCTVTCFGPAPPSDQTQSCRSLQLPTTTGPATTPVQTSATITTATTTAGGTPKPPCTGCCRLCLLLLLLLLLLPIPIPPPWPGYPIYVVLCRIPNQSSSTGSPRPGWHTHYMCGRRTNNVYFSALFVTNDGRIVLIWSRSPTTGRFVWYGTEMTPDTNSSGARHEMDAPPSHRNNVSAESGAVNNGNKHSSQKEKNKHIGTDGSNNSS